MEAGVEFVACDMPHANKLTIHILAAVAEHEREAISARTKAALAAIKARGRRPKQALAAKLGATANREAADRFAANTLPIVRTSSSERHHHVARHRRCPGGSRRSDCSSGDFSSGPRP